MQDTGITRRESILTMGAAAGSLLLGASPRPLLAASTENGRKRALRIAHLTDIHVEPEKRALIQSVRLDRVIPGRPKA